MSSWAEILAAVMLITLVVYALFGGADFGGGVWDLFAVGPRAKQHRKLIEKAIAPVWEANHVWLIVVVVLLFSGFPRAFSSASIALYIPLSGLLVTIVLRGVAFVIRQYGMTSESRKSQWGRLFAIASIFAPLWLGAILAAISSGEIRVVEGEVITDSFAGWATPFAILVGCLVATLFALLAAVYLIFETDSSEIKDDFRARALWAELVAGVLATALVFAAEDRAPSLREGLFHTYWGPPLQLVVGLVAGGAIFALIRRHFRVARILAVAQVVLVIVGWGLAQYPMLIAPDISLFNAAAPDITLKLILSALGVGALVLLPSLGALFRLFKR